MNIINYNQYYKIKKNLIALTRTTTTSEKREMNII